MAMIACEGIGIGFALAILASGLSVAVIMHGWPTRGGKDG